MTEKNGKRKNERKRRSEAHQSPDLYLTSNFESTKRDLKSNQLPIESPRSKREVSITKNLGTKKNLIHQKALFDRQCSGRAKSSQAQGDYFPLMLLSLSATFNGLKRSPQGSTSPSPPPSLTRRQTSKKCGQFPGTLTPYWVSVSAQKTSCAH